MSVTDDAAARIAANVSGAIAKSRRAANRAARSIRSRSSLMRDSASPIARTSPAFRSERPPTKSITSPVSGSWKSALIVKSRRCASISAVPKWTAVGRRPSTYASSERNVATSNCQSPSSTRITPNAAPTPTVRRKSFRTASGGAAVATS
jgi:hypothetical protein